MTLTDDNETLVDRVLTELDWYYALLAEAWLEHQAIPPSRRRKIDARGGDHEIEDLASATARLSTEQFERIAVTVELARALIRDQGKRIDGLLEQLRRAEGCELRQNGESCPALTPARRLVLAPPLRRPA